MLAVSFFVCFSLCCDPLVSWLFNVFFVFQKMFSRFFGPTFFRDCFSRRAQEGSSTFFRDVFSRLFFRTVPKMALQLFSHIFFSRFFFAKCTGRLFTFFPPIFSIFLRPTFFFSRSFFFILRFFAVFARFFAIFAVLRFSVMFAIFHDRARRPGNCVSTKEKACFKKIFPLAGGAAGHGSALARHKRRAGGPESRETALQTKDPGNAL